MSSMDIEPQAETVDDSVTEEETAPSNVTQLFPDQAQHLRMLEALLFAAAEPLDQATIEARLPENIDIESLLEQLQKLYENRGVNLIEVDGRWTFRTAADLAFMMQKDAVEQRRLSRAGIETLAIIAYHQPVTRAEIEEIRGVSVSKGTLDVLMEVGWVRPRGRRRVPGRPVTYGTTHDFMSHFGLAAIGDLPGMEELKAAGLLDANLPPNFEVPAPKEEAEDDDEEEFSAEFAAGNATVDAIEEFAASLNEEGVIRPTEDEAELEDDSEEAPEVEMSNQAVDSAPEPDDAAVEEDLAEEQGVDHLQDIEEPEVEEATEAEDAAEDEADESQDADR